MINKKEELARTDITQYQENSKKKERLLLNLK